MNNFLLQSSEAHGITGHMCQYGMMTPGSDSEPVYARKPTRWLSNSPHLIHALGDKCEGGINTTDY